MSEVEAAKRRSAQGEGTRTVILKAAVDLASEHGLEGLTIGRLADTVSMSKSGLFAHFGSKEDLQLATLEAAREIFVAEVMRPGLKGEKGLPRLKSLLAAWISYAERGVFKGGCFFTAASLEFDSRGGPVRDRVADIMRDWLGTLERAGREAIEAGHLSAKIDPAQLAFEMHALAMGANWAFMLYGDQSAFRRALAGIEARLASGTPSA
jgi:AcrR family transcriptional regulator